VTSFFFIIIIRNVSDVGMRVTRSVTYGFTKKSGRHILMSSVRVKFAYHAQTCLTLYSKEEKI